MHACDICARFTDGHRRFPLVQFNDNHTWLVPGWELGVEELAQSVKSVGHLYQAMGDWTTPATPSELASRFTIGQHSIPRVWFHSIQSHSSFTLNLVRIVSWAWITRKHLDRDNWHFVNE